MRLALTDEQELIQATAREFAQSEIRPIAAEIDRDGRFPHETARRWASWAHGHRGARAMGRGRRRHGVVRRALEEIAKACASHAVIMSVNNSLYGDPLLKFGTDAQRERFLAPVASGHVIGCFALTEPQAGSDAANQATTARRHGDHYVLTGRKLFITNGRESAFALVFAQTDRARPIGGSPRSSSRRAPRASRSPRRKTSSGSAPPTPPSWCSTSAGCRPPTGSARKGRASASR
jgi:butyryl-CoA dehydrogenase